MTDRAREYERRDRATRERVDEIAAANERWRDAVDERYRRVVRLVILAVVLSTLTVPFIYLTVQGQRLRQTRVACLLRNESSDSTVRLLIDLDVRQSVLEVARENFPREPDCEAHARAAVGGFASGITFFSGDRVRTPPPPELPRAGG